MNMKIEDHLSEEQKRKLKYKSGKKKKKTKKKEEKVDWVEIMGTNMQTLRRGKGGAMRRR
jgi:hypothetical protein